jgi:hypothetical protein
MTSLAVAQTSGDVLVLEGLALPQSHRYAIYNAASATYSPVDASGNLDPCCAAASGQAATSAKPAPSGEWQRIHGKIERIQGSTLSGLQRPQRPDAGRGRDGHRAPVDRADDGARQLRAAGFVRPVARQHDRTVGVAARIALAPYAERRAPVSRRRPGGCATA